MPDPDELPLPSIDGYTILKALGRGGMGAVWHAVQLATNREVALKTIFTESLPSSQLRFRFQREVELAARLDHPNITRIYASGQCRGQYYYAMELVRGKPFRARAQGLDLPARLRLVARTADALAYAHLKGVIHRDLKPDNILVTDDDEPHLLDFGLAKEILAGDASGVTEMPLTREGTVAGTPRYMAPEQARGDLAAVDVRSDIYSLGVILHEAVVGQVPFPENYAGFEWVRRLNEDDVPSPRALNPGLDPEVEAIMLKALSRDPADRYASMAEFAADLRRHLSGDPVTAQKQTVWYLARKRVVKHRVPLSLAAGLLAVAAVAGFRHVSALKKETDRAVQAEYRTARQLQEAQAMRERAETARAEADHARRQAEEVSDFLLESLRSPHPEQDGRTVTVSQTLDRARAWLRDRFASAPATKGKLLWGIGQTYLGLGMYEKADDCLSGALALFRAELGERHPTTLQASLGQALAAQSLGRVEAAEPVYRRLSTLPDGEADGVRLDALHNLAGLQLQRGEVDPARALYQRVLAERLRVAGPDDAETLKTRINLAVLERRLGRPESALEHCTNAAQRAEAALGPEHPVTLAAQAGAALALSELGRAREAAELTDRILAAQTRVYGEEHPIPLATRENRARLHADLGEPEAAIRLYQHVLALRAPGPEQVATALRLGRLLEQQRRTDEAGALYERFPLDEDAVEALAILHVDNGRFARAEPLLRAVWSGRSKRLGESHPRALDALHNLALTLEKLERRDEARAALETWTRLKEAAKSAGNP